MTIEQPNAFFVYGTLKRGEINHRLLAPYLRSVDPAWLPGRLYDVGEFPALVEGDGIVHGDLIRVDSALLSEIVPVLDRLEGCIPGNDPESLYHRKVVTVTTADGSVHMAYAYFYNWAHPDLPPSDLLRTVPDGRWSGMESSGPTGSEELDAYRRHVRDYADLIPERAPRLER